MYSTRISMLMMLGLLIVTVVGGCSPSARPSNPEEGRQALQRMLDAWKAGAKPDAFAAENPTIHAKDGDWRSGLVLRNYTAEFEGKLIGSDLNYAVELELKNAKGRISKKRATYAVTTHPILLVLRTDE